MLITNKLNNKYNNKCSKENVNPLFVLPISVLKELSIFYFRCSIQENITKTLHRFCQPTPQVVGYVEKKKKSFNIRFSLRD